MHVAIPFYLTFKPNNYEHTVAVVEQFKATNNKQELRNDVKAVIDNDPQKAWDRMLESVRKYVASTELGKAGKVKVKDFTLHCALYEVSSNNDFWIGTGPNRVAWL